MKLQSTDIIKGRESHSFEVPSVTLLTSHSEPHRCPLSMILKVESAVMFLCNIFKSQEAYHWLDNLRHLVHESYGTGDMVQSGDFADLLHKVSFVDHCLPNIAYLPWTWNILQQLQDSVRDVFQRSKVHTLIIPELPVRHVAMILDDLSDMLWWELLHRNQRLFARTLGQKIARRRGNRMR